MLGLPAVPSVRKFTPLIAGLALAMIQVARATAADDAKVVAALDTEFQAAVKRNDAATIGRILADDMILVTGRGKVFTAKQHVEAAQNQERIYEQQDEEPGSQTVRVWGDTATVTALLWIKGTAKDGKPFDYKLWFSDTYARTPAGWKYVFGQASLPLPKETP
jgi:ketosteroid isomerase-like protein